MITRRFLAPLAAGAALSVLAVRPAAAYRPGGAGLDIAKVDRPGEGSVNSHILAGPASVAILDCQRTAVEARQVAALARGLGLPVEAIVLSHEHPDHVGGLEVIARAFPQAPIMASETTRDFIARSGRDLMATMRTAFGAAAMPDGIPVPNRILRPGERLRLAGAEWVVDQLGPYEAQGMTMLYAEANDVLFAADLFSNRVTPWLVDGTTGGWIAELGKALTRYGPVGTALPGHGAAGPAEPLLRDQLEYLGVFRALVQAETGGGGTSPADAAPRVRRAIEARYPGFPKVAPSPNLIEMNVAVVARELRG